MKNKEVTEELREVFANIATYNELAFHEKDRACPICGIKPITMSDFIQFNFNNSLEKRIQQERNKQRRASNE